MPKPRKKLTLTTVLLRVDGITHTTELINNKVRNQSLFSGQQMNGNIFAMLCLLYFQFIKPDIILRGNEEGTCVLVDRNIIKREAEKILNRRSAHVECKTRNNRGDWNHINIIQTIPERHTVKARKQGTTDNSHIGHCAHIAGRTNTRVPSIQHEK